MISIRHGMSYILDMILPDCMGEWSNGLLHGSPTLDIMFSFARDGGAAFLNEGESEARGGNDMPSPGR